MEFDDKREFLKTNLPFSQLSESQLEQSLKHLKICYEKAGSSVSAEEMRNVLCLMRTGSGELRSESSGFMDRLGSGDSVGFHRLYEPSGDDAQFNFLEDSLVYQFPRELLEQFGKENGQIATFLSAEKEQRLHSSLDAKARDYRLNQRVEELMISAPLCAYHDTSIADCAQLMSDARVSSILIVDGESLTGIATDRDLRSRVLAAKLDIESPISSVMTPNLETISPKQTVYEAQLVMMTANIHHLPVVDHKDGVIKPIGIISLNDFIRAQNSEPVYMIQAINRAKNRDGLYTISKLMPELIHKMIRANVRAQEIGRIITSVTDSFTRQLLSLAHRNFGQAPCKYSWVVFGSQARQDQMLGSDQDNGLILEHHLDEEGMAFFKKVSAFVNEGLDKCGLRLCPGNVMAMNPKWCQTLDTWCNYFITWIRKPEPKALMHASIFYDLRHVVGDRELTDNLRNVVLEEAKPNSIFHACMLENALQSSPPLGFFKTFVLEKDGNHNSVLDLKHRGTVPIVALVRLYCLANGIAKVNTEDRISALKEQGVISENEAQNLLDAHEFIASLRLENQSRALSAGAEISNNLNPDELSPLVRHQLKDAFSVVAESQKHLKMRFGHGAL